MDYIYSQIDPSVFDLSKCLIFHNFRELPEPQEKLYKRVAFVTETNELNLLTDSAYICLLVDGVYNWIDVFSNGVNDEEVRHMQIAISQIREVLAGKADVNEVVESFQEVDEMKADKEFVNSKFELIDNNFETVISKINEKADANTTAEALLPLIVNVAHNPDGLAMDKTWKEIMGAFLSGKNVLCKYWPEWLEGATYYPPRALYPMTGIGMLNENEFVCYTGDGIFMADTPESYPIIESYSEQDGELVPVQLTCSRDDTQLYVDEALTITAFADFGGEYKIEWEIEPLEGGLDDFHYIKEGNDLTITPKLSILGCEYQPKIKIIAKLRGIPSICVPLYITAIPERLV